MNRENDSENNVDATPSKSFFVNMLTRDIELKDAILDLLDNCLDGVLRTLKSRNPDENVDEIVESENPYRDFYAHIEYGADFFRITDNCGGMSLEILENHAFRLGREALGDDKNLATVGLYGIGMKRAIFKMGESCTVKTKHDDNAYQVKITPEWLKDDDAWRLKTEEVSAEDLEEGTIIEINQLIEDVGNEFDVNKDRSFDDEFQKLVATHYSYIIHKGFKVRVNNQIIEPSSINLKIAENPNENNKIAPYLYEGEFDGVTVKISVGLYMNVPTESEIEEMNLGKGNRKENAGWTVICNDRVVIYNDTTHLTGWGVGNVPKYHTQFIAISGIVRFYSANPAKLPLTTTKRGINLNSALYATVSNIMREGMKHFTDFTNKWKSDSDERRSIYAETKAVEPLKAFDLIKEDGWKEARKFGGRKFIPNLPQPEEEGDPNKIVRYTRPKSEIALLSEYFFGDRNEPPNRVGEKCFNDYLELAKSDT